MEKVTEQTAPTVLTSDTENATTIPVEKAPPQKQQKFRKFRAYNTGLWNGPQRENTEAFRRQDDLHRYDAVASHLELTDYQKQRGRKMMDDLDFQKLGKPIDQIIFAVCVIVANRDVNDGSRYWPHPNAKNNDQRFAEVSDDLGLTRKEQLSSVQQIKAKL